MMLGATPQTKYCVSCNEAAMANFRFCPKCGSKDFTDDPQTGPAYSQHPVNPWVGATRSSSSPDKSRPPPRQPSRASVPVTQAAQRPDDYRLAGFWWRVLPAVIDSLVLSSVSGVAGIVMAATDVDKQWFVAWLILSIIGTWLYHALFESSPLRATLGKKCCGLRVVTTDGHRISFGRASGRFAGKLLSALVLGIGFMMAGWTKRKQALHDLMSNCLVLKKHHQNTDGGPRRLTWWDALAFDIPSIP